MMTRWSHLLVSALCSGALLIAPARRLTAQELGSSPSQPITAVIDVTQTGEPIDPMMWGHFIENLSSYLEGGLWAELIGDRKFFYPVNDAPLDPPNSRSGWVNRWWPLGPEASVVMDSTRAYAGKHSPRVVLAGDDPRGIRQDLGIRAGRDYTGRIVLAADGSADVNVTLIWGPGPEDREAVTLSDLSDEWDTYPLSFSPSGGSRDGSIEITGSGSGSFLIGAVSLMPADNVEGWDREVLELVRRTNPSTLRWGGNFSSGYEWRDGIGDPDKRPPRYDHAWGALEPNDVGTLEMLALNRLLGSEPNIGVNAGFGDAHSAAQWVEYVNGSVETPMGRLRAEHGHPEPFGVRWWGIGNEMYGPWQLGHMAIDDYVIKHNQFAEAMRAVDPSILLVASGATLYQMHADGEGRMRLDQPPYAHDSPLDWSGNLLRHSWQYMDYLAEHIYHPIDSYYDVTTQRWIEDDDAPPGRLARRLANRARGAVEEWQGYLERMPWLSNTDIRLVMDEWSGGGSGVFRLLSVPMVLHEMFRHTDVYSRSDHTSVRRLFDANRYDKPVLRASGLVFEVYTNHFGSIPILDIGGNSPQPEIPGTTGVDRPVVSSGSPTYPLDVMASLSEDGARLSVAVVNQSETERYVRLAVRNAVLPDSGRQWTITGPSIDALNYPGEPQVINTTESNISDPDGVQTVAPYSSNMYVFELR